MLDKIYSNYFCNIFSVPYLNFLLYVTDFFNILVFSLKLIASIGWKLENNVDLNSAIASRNLSDYFHLNISQLFDLG